MTNFAPFDAADYLNDEETIAEYITAALEDPNPDVFLIAVRDVARARGMTQLAKDALLESPCTARSITSRSRSVSNRNRSVNSLRSTEPWRVATSRRSASLMLSSNCCSWYGFWTKSTAPALSALTAMGMSPWPLTNTMGMRAWVLV